MHGAARGAATPPPPIPPPPPLCHTPNRPSPRHTTVWPGAGTALAMGSARRAARGGGAPDGGRPRGGERWAHGATRGREAARGAGWGRSRRERGGWCARASLANGRRGAGPPAAARRENAPKAHRGATPGRLTWRGLFLSLARAPHPHPQTRPPPRPRRTL